jgi:hypothetical protein
MTHQVAGWSERLQARTSNLLKPTGKGKKSILRQLREIIKLRYGPTKLHSSEYFYYSLFDKDVYGDDVDLSAFCGTHMKEWLHQQLNSPLWDAVVTDKFIMSQVFQSTGVPHPDIYAVACRFPRNCGDVPVFRSARDLADFFRKDIPFPFFGKPIKGGSASGCLRVEAYDSSSDRLQLADGSHVEVDDFVASLDDQAGWGFIFQEAVVGHEETADLCGSSVSGCRVVALLDDDKAYPIRVIWKIPARGNYTDNYVHGNSGNLLADIDLVSGTARRVVSGSGLNLKINPTHPDTGATVLGRRLPEWDALLDMLQVAVPAFPGFRLQHWDIGLTSKGLVAFELNTAGDLDLVDLPHGAGFYDSRLKEFMARVEPSGRRVRLKGAPVNLD